MTNRKKSFLLHIDSLDILDDLTVTVLDEDDVTVLVVLDVSADGRIRTRTT